MEIVMRQRSKAERESSRQGLRAERRNVVGGGKTNYASRTEAKRLRHSPTPLSTWP